MNTKTKKIHTFCHSEMVDILKLHLNTSEIQEEHFRVWDTHGHEFVFTYVEVEK